MKLQMSAQEIADTKSQVNISNKKIGVNVEGEKNKLEKEAFLKLLVTQLKHQDPTKPLEDREFIAQMANFSSLEQMRNLNAEIRTLVRSASSSEANSFIGKEVDSFDSATSRKVSGIVSSVKYKDDQVRLIVDGNEVEVKNVHLVRNPAADKTALPSENRFLPVENENTVPADAR